MPRKTDPRLGEDGYETDPERPFDKNAARTLLMEFMPDADQGAVDVHVDGIQDLQQRYWRWNGRGASAFSRAEARKAIELFLAGGAHTWAEINGLNERARDVIFDHLMVMKDLLPGETEPTVYQALIEDRVREAVIEKAAREVLADLKAQKGADTEGVTPHIVAELCKVYESMTGRPVTHSTRSPEADYTPGPQSEGGRFVLAMMQVIDPDNRNTKVSSALRSFIEFQNRPD
tara:strand:- start:570 stop:1265 length:696 start_codon:yes stop_codon:yes gene_type:complete